MKIETTDIYKSIKELKAISNFVYDLMLIRPDNIQSISNIIENNKCNTHFTNWPKYDFHSYLLKKEEIIILNRKDETLLKITF